MNKINRKLEYALIALKHMNHKRPGELSTVKDICQTYSCPFDATSRVMQSMSQKQILKSEQGAYGGYQILRDLRKVSLFELIEAVVGPIEIAKCLQQNSEGAHAIGLFIENLSEQSHTGQTSSTLNILVSPQSKCDLAPACNIASPIHFLNDKLIRFYKSMNIHEILTSDQSGGRMKQEELQSKTYQNAEARS